MHINEDVSQCVAFLGYMTDRGRRLGGTAFFYSFPITKEFRAGNLVTARHVIDEIRDRSTDGLVHVRINKKDGGVDYMMLKPESWIPHRDARVDLAVCPINIKDDSPFQMTWVSAEQSLSNDEVRELQIAPGCEVFMVGCFTRHFGAARNVPIVRSYSGVPA